jgi:hypothetical protein
MKKILVFIFLCSPIFILAQKNKAKKAKPTDNFSTSITPADLKTHLYIVAGREM